MSFLLVALLFACLLSASKCCIPKQVHIAIGENTHERVIVWSSKVFVTDGFVQYGTHKKILNMTAVGHKHLLQNPENDQNIHYATLSNLESNKKYWYRVGIDGCWSKVFSFRTFKAGQNWSPKFSVFGDLGLERGFSLNKLIDEAKKENVDVVLHAGDIGYNLCDDNGTLGDKYLKTVEPLTSRVPYMVVPGNHEFQKEPSGMNYRKRFMMPGGSPDFHSFEVGPVKIIGFTTEAYWFGEPEVVKAQEEYLKKVLTEANEQRDKFPWIVAFGHRPIYCTSTVPGRCNYNSDLNHAGLEDIFNEYGVDLVISGHNHHYERLYPVYKDKTFKKEKHYYDNPEAPVYIVSGAAGNYEELQKFNKTIDFPYSAERLRKFGYTRFQVHNSTHLYLEQVDATTDKVHDHVWITQSAHGYRSR